MKTCLLITTYNRSRLLRSSLERLRELTVPDEILVVDDGGSDGCRAMLEQLAHDLPVPLRYIYNHNPGSSICSLARNIGILNTDADVLITSEPEVRFRTDAVAQLLERHREMPDKVISAGTIHHQQQDGREETVRGWVAPYTALYRRDWLVNLGGWDEAFPGPWGWDDTDLLTRLRLSGFGQFIDLGIEVAHQWHPKNTIDQSPNERHFFAKRFHRDESDTADIVANRGTEWGRIRTN